MKPYAGAEAGKCSVVRDDSGVIVIPPGAEHQAKLTIRGERLQILNGIADRCHLPRSTFKLVGDEDLHVQPNADAKYEDVDCALTELQKAHLPVKLGFVGNEYYSNEVQ